jgi:hypothetical protein
MDQTDFSQQQPGILAQIRQGMEVYDRANNKVGTVQDIQFGESSQQAFNEREGAATAQTHGAREGTWLGNLLSSLFPDEVPEVLRDRLIRHGYIQIDTGGITDRDRYATPDQIAGVSGDKVTLNVLGDELIRQRSIV